MKSKSNKNSWNIDESGRLSRRVVFECSGLLSSEKSYTSELFYDVLNSELNTLPELQRICLQLYHEEGLSAGDLSKILMISEFGVNLYLEKGLENLQKSLSRMGASLSSRKLVQSLKSKPKEVASESLKQKIMSMIGDGSWTEEG